MSPRVERAKTGFLLRTPRIPKFLSHCDLFLKALTKNDLFFDQGFFITKGDPSISALTKRDFLFDQGFFIAHLSRFLYLFRIVISKANAFKKFFPQYYICFPTSVFEPVFFYDPPRPRGGANEKER